MRETVFANPEIAAGRLNTSLRRTQSWITAHADFVTTLALFLGFLLLRLPLRSDYPANWDAVQMVLGIQNFDLHHHQPHPPGYIGYIFLGKALNVVVGDPHASLTLIAALAGAFAPAMLYPLARRMMANWAALCVTIAFGCSMLVWYYSEVALTYAVELALLLPFLYLMHRALTDLSRRDLLFATMLLATVGAFRQTAFILLLPLWFWVLLRYSWRDRFYAAGLLAGAVLAWLAPLLLLAGGPFVYLHESQQLAELTGGHTSILSVNLSGPAQNFAFVFAGVLLGVNVGLVALFVGSGAVSRLLRRARQERIFFALWGIPALGIYLLGHVGQIGYILILLPIPYLWMGVALQHFGSSRRTLRMLQVPTPGYAGALLTAIFVTVNVFGFFALPKAVNHAVPRSVQQDVRQFDLQASDNHWSDLSSTLANYPADGTAILTTIGGPRTSGSFRHLAYLLPDYHVYGLGTDLDNGAFAPLFHAQNGRNDYSIEGMHDANPWLVLPKDTRYVLIPDQEIVERLKGAFTQYTTQLESGGEVTVLIVDPATTLAFSVQGEVITVLGCMAWEAPCHVPPPSRTG